jgi:hypothetical protein
VNQSNPINEVAPTTLNQARRQLDKAQTAFHNIMLSSLVRGTPSAAGDDKAWNDCYYGSSTLKSFTARYVAFAKASPMRAAHAAPIFDLVRQSWETYDAFRLAEKNRLAVKRAAVAAKRDLKKELNLQEGVSLKGVDVGQYEVIIKGLEPVRKYVYEVTKSNLESDRDDLAERMEKAGFKVDVVNPATYHTETSRFARELAFDKYCDLDTRIRKWFSVGYDKVGTLRSDNAARIVAESKQRALAYIQGYAAKLAVKTGEYIADKGLTLAGGVCTVQSASVSTNSLWQDSIATISLGNGMIRFHTQVIWNRSCLGKVFNQYPTRLLS